MDTRNKRLTFRITQKQQEWLKEASYNWRLSVNQILHNALDEFIEKRGQTHEE